MRSILLGAIAGGAVVAVIGAVWAVAGRWFGLDAAAALLVLALIAVAVVRLLRDVTRALRHVRALARERHVGIPSVHMPDSARRRRTDERYGIAVSRLLVGQTRRFGLLMGFDGR